MTFHDLLIDLSERPMVAAEAIAATPVSLERANAHLGDHPNSIVWLLWHTGRELDIQLAEITGAPQVWQQGNIGERTGLDDAMGYGHSDTQARAIRVDTQQQYRALLDYLRQTLQATRDFAATLTPALSAQLIDANVTVGVRLVSIIDDAIQHLAQVQYVLGAPALADAASS